MLAHRCLIELNWQVKVVRCSAMILYMCVSLGAEIDEVWASVTATFRRNEANSSLFVLFPVMLTVSAVSNARHTVCYALIIDLHL